MTSSTAGKVGNIRALFEAKQELSSSPPSRGRSPAGSDIHSIRSISSRPVSKIRNSFVAVEKSGSMGPILGLRRVSDVQDASEPGTDLRSAITRSASNAEKGSIAEETELESKIDEDGRDGITKSKQALEDKAVSSGDKSTKDTSSASVLGTTKGKKAIGIIPPTIKTQPKLKGALTPTTKQPISPREIKDKNKAEPRKPAAIRTRPAPDSLQATSLKAKPAIPSSSGVGVVPRTRVKQEPISKPASRVSTPRTSLASNTPRGNGPTKTRPKSPTRPVRLPAAAMASTASSAAKTATGDRPSSQNSTKPRVSSGGDFLARMMRPTAASASKAHEKLVTGTEPHKVNATRARKTGEVPQRKPSDTLRKRVSEGRAKPTAMSSSGAALSSPSSSKDFSGTALDNAEDATQGEGRVEKADGTGTSGGNDTEARTNTTPTALSDTIHDTQESRTEIVETEPVEYDSSHDAELVEINAAEENSALSSLENHIPVSDESVSSEVLNEVDQVTGSNGEPPKPDFEARHINEDRHKDADILKSSEKADDNELGSVDLSHERQAKSEAAQAPEISEESIENPVEESMSEATESKKPSPEHEDEHHTPLSNESTKHTTDDNVSSDGKPDHPVIDPEDAITF